jgi:hypothetical protein
VTVWDALSWFLAAQCLGALLGVLWLALVYGRLWWVKGRRPNDGD